jgi:TetR/AcrR family transcriptional regulator, transcriptional repressor for nem operon
MARIRKEDEHNAKRNEILDFALTLIYSKGYERMTIQDILDGLQISRGALYHYFDSKLALLEALVERLGRQGAQVLLPIVQDPHLTAIEKLRRYFETSAQVKSTQKELIISLLREWYTDDNAIIRQKMASGSLNYTAPLIIEPIIRQGIQEGVFTTRYPQQVAKFVMGIALTFADVATEHLLAAQPDEGAIQELEAMLHAYFDTVERILGAPAGSLQVLTADAFTEWLSASQPEPAPHQE